MSIGRRDFLRGAAVGAGILAQRESQAQEARTGLVAPFTFAVVADTHCGENPKPGIEKYGTGVDKFMACVRAMEALEGEDRPDFMLHVGDVHPWALDGKMDAVTIPVHAIAGNHESTKEKRTQLRDLFPDDFIVDGKPSDFYAFVHQGVRFIGLCNAGRGGEHVGQFCSEIINPRGQCEWFEEQLAKPEARKVVFAHVPPELEGKDRNMFMGRNDARWFNALIGQHQPDAMFFGHLHQKTEEHRVEETRSINLRSCCWNFGQAPLGFMLVQVLEDGIRTKEIETGEYST
jgi:3',5'-cyclic AMP phosphodiesterase CpdA